MSAPGDIKTQLVDLVAPLVDTVFKGKRSFHENELPAINCYMSPREKTAEQGTSYLVSAQMIVEYYQATDETVEVDDQAEAMLAEVRGAIELDANRYLTGLVNPGLSWGGDRIDYPDDGGGILSVTVFYDVPHVDQYG